MYVVPVSFDSIESALDYLKTELQAKVDQNNTMVMEQEKATATTALLSEQESELTEKCLALSRKITELENKRETIKQEVKDHAKKTTDRLEKERADFEAVRIKRREELVSIENGLERRSQELDQETLRLNRVEESLKERENELIEVQQTITQRQNSFNNQQAEIDRQKAENDKQLEIKSVALANEQEELNQQRQIHASHVADLERAKTTVKNLETEADKYHKQARDLLLGAESKVAKIEAVNVRFNEREEDLNRREAHLKELSKTLTARKIQLDDREATINSRGSI